MILLLKYYQFNIIWIINLPLWFEVKYIYILNYMSHKCIWIIIILQTDYTWMSLLFYCLIYIYMCVVLFIHLALLCSQGQRMRLAHMNPTLVPFFKKKKKKKFFFIFSNVRKCAILHASRMRFWIGILSKTICKQFLTYEW